jgi:hypothetical protein
MAILHRITPTITIPLLSAFAIEIRLTSKPKIALPAWLSLYPKYGLSIS